MCQRVQMNTLITLPGIKCLRKSSRPIFFPYSFCHRPSIKENEAISLPAENPIEMVG